MLPRNVISNQHAIYQLLFVSSVFVNHKLHSQICELFNLLPLTPLSKEFLPSCKDYDVSVRMTHYFKSIFHEGHVLHAVF